MTPALEAISRQSPETPGRTPYSSALEPVLDALAELDRGLAEVLERSRRRRVEDLSLRGLLVTESEAKEILEPDGRLSLGGRMWGRIAPRLSAGGEAGAEQPIHVLQRRFGLSVFETECLLLCLAPEVDGKYERLFGYLNDDITRKHPSVHLMLDLLTPQQEEPAAFRRLLSANGVLLRSGMLAWAEEAPSGLSHPGRCLKAETDVVQYLLGEPGIDPELRRVWDDPVYPRQARGLWDGSNAHRQIEALLADYFGSPEARDCVVCVVAGRPGSGRRYAVEKACGARGMNVLALDGRRLLRCQQAEAMLLRAFRNSLMLGAPLLVANADAIVDDQERGPELRWQLERMANDWGWLLFLTAEQPGALRGWFPRRRLVEFAVPELTRRERAGGWQRLLGDETELPPAEADALAEALASKFHLTPGQIVLAFQRAWSARIPDLEGRSWWDALHRCAADVSAPRLGELARKLKPLYRWRDIVLTANRMALLEDVARRVRQQRKVMEDWRFEGVMNRGKGLNVLFSGPSGTGKTMAAEVIANELDMDLYRIDLASVVSKFIGETEKNLARIFREAEHSDAVLFFDEADALFGKRSEVRDAHDRYANIEINYLLQQMENYEGIAILATNLRQNLDEAFLRRIHILVEFPAPVAAERLRIWRKAFPAEAPLAADVDFEFLAQAFDLTGGSIRNVTLAAAYLAAERGGAIAMEHLVEATQRELDKIGKRAVKEQFGPYFHLLDAPGTARPKPAGEDARHGMSH